MILSETGEGLYLLFVASSCTAWVISLKAAVGYTAEYKTSQCGH